MRLRELHILSYWHGTHVTGLKELKPFASNLVGHKAVFAAIYPEVAVAMGNFSSEDDFEFGRSYDPDNDDPEDVPYVFQELKAGMFKKFFGEGHPVTLYEVSSKGFHTDKHIQDFEVICDHAVKILDEKLIDNPLKYLDRSKMVQIRRYSQE
jgi:hypothetical protein